MGGESPAVAPAVVLQPPAVVNPSATTALPETPSSASLEGSPTQSSNAPVQPAAPPSAAPEQPAVAAASPEAPAASTALSPAAPVAPATPAGQRQFIVKGPLPERQETDPAVRLAPNTVNSATSMPPPPPPTARVAPTPAAPAATAPSRGVARPEILTDLTAGFYVQHIASPSRGNVEVFWRSRPVLRQARLLELRRAPGSQSPNFVLVSGPFESMEQAQRFMAQPGLPRDMWLREASKIRPLLPNP